MISSDSVFNTAVFQALCACLEISPVSAEASSASSIVATPHSGDRSFRMNSGSTILPPLAVVDPSSLLRPFPNNPESPPAPPRSVNVIYFDIRPESAPDALYQTYTSEDTTVYAARSAVSSFLPYRLILVCYGPDCEQFAHRIRSFLFLDGSGYPRAILRQAGIYPVPRPAMPILLDEEEGALFRKRADLTISLRVKDTLIRTNRRFGITEPPAVIPFTGYGLSNR